MSLDCTLGTLIKIKINSSLSGSCETSLNKENNKVSKNNSDDKLENFIKLPNFLDPNLNLTGYLCSLEVPVQSSMNQSWNIAPYFLDEMPLSTCCSMNDNMLIFGGLDPTNPNNFVLGGSIFEFGSKSERWNYYGSMLEPRCYHATATVNSYIYISGGYSLIQRSHGEMLALPYTDRLDITTTMWKRCASMSVARASHTMIQVKGNLYVFGGRDSSGRILDSVEMYDIHQDKWSKIASLPKPTMGLSATVLDNVVWLLGGITSEMPEHKEQSFLSDVYSFIPLSCCWSVEKSLPAPHAYSSAFSLEGSIWVVGGCHLSQDQNLRSCSCVWQLAVFDHPQVWKNVTCLSVSTHASATALCGKKLLVFGGINSPKKGALDIVQVLNTVTGSIEGILKLPAAIAGSKAVLLSNELKMEKEKQDNELCAYKNNFSSFKGCSNWDDSENIERKRGYPTCKDLILKAEKIQSFKVRLNQAKAHKHSLKCFEKQLFKETDYYQHRASFEKEIASNQNTTLNYQKELSKKACERGIQVSQHLQTQMLMPEKQLTISSDAKEPFDVDTESSQSRFENETTLKGCSCTKQSQYITTLEVPLNREKNTLKLDFPIKAEITL